MALTLDPSLLNNTGEGSRSPLLSKDRKGIQNSPLPTAWQQPGWQKSFELDAALTTAYREAKSYMNKLLEPDGMAVDLSSQGDDIIGSVREVETGRVLKSYNGLDMLRLYAHNVRPRGLVVDGTL
jgi:hypothetical protein